MLLLLAAMGPLFVAISSAPAYANGPTITGAGSSYASVAIDQWVAEISSIDGDTVNYSDVVVGHRAQRVRSAAGEFRGFRDRLQHRDRRTRTPSRIRVPVSA